ncbi:MAG: right-handed parallel beta-helix repeat-containing protein [Phycisphaerae bacterium]|nr:right-handed parallel beta-helix repeat-containing protein [Phycisphaerae bacterium]
MLTHKGLQATATSGPDSFEFVANDGGTPPDGGDSNTATISIITQRHILFVDAEATGGHNGLTWADAYVDLQSALEDAAVSHGLTTEIWIAGGTYTPSERTDPSNPRTATFALVRGVAICGGFAGTENSLNQRDLSNLANETILSGDLAGNDGPGFLNNEENSYHVLTSSDADETAVLDGFTVTGGNANGDSPHYQGGGIYVAPGTPTLVNCTFADNAAEYGGGMSNRYGSSPTLINCTFSGNLADEDGGGLSNHYSSPTLIACTLVGNSANDDGGGIRNYYSEPVLITCQLIGNSGIDNGGGVYDGSGSSSTSQTLMTNCTFWGNHAGDRGGGTCTIGSSVTQLTNCILWGNTADSSGAQIYGTSSVVTYSCIQGGWSGTGNIPGDPLFVDPDGPDDIPGTADDNLRLSDGSPCINTGDPGFVPEPAETDLDGHARVLCDRVDMGAYEFGIGDYDCNEVVDGDDFAYWGTCMTGPDNGPYDLGCEAFDFEFDGDVDLSDFAGFQVVFGG